MTFSDMLINCIRTIGTGENEEDYRWTTLFDAKRHVRVMIDERMREIISYIKTHVDMLYFLLYDIDQLLKLNSSRPEIYNLLVMKINIPTRFVSFIMDMVTNEIGLQASIKSTPSKDFYELYIGFVKGPKHMEEN